MRRRYQRTKSRKIQRKSSAQKPSTSPSRQSATNQAEEASHVSMQSAVGHESDQRTAPSRIVDEQIRQTQSNQQVQRLLAQRLLTQRQHAAQSAQVQESSNRAVERNVVLGSRLGWDAQADQIVVYLQGLHLLAPNQSPGPELFAEGVQKYQASVGLVPDGILGPNTWRRLRRGLNGRPESAKADTSTSDESNHAGSNKLTKLEKIMARIYREHGEFLLQKSSELGIDVADAAAFLKVESGGEGFSRQTNSVKIRFENHVFYRLWGQGNPEQYREHFKFNAQKHWRGHQFRASSSGEFESVHSSQEREWEVLDFARTLDSELALQSISMGSAQILGINYALAGYESATEMFDDMAESIDAQNEGLFSYIKRKRKGIIIRALQAKDYEVAARYYNGKGKEALYGRRIKAASEAYQRALTKLNSVE